MEKNKKIKAVSSWAGKKLASGMLFSLGIGIMIAGVYAFQALTNDPTAPGFTSNGAPMLTRSGGTFDRETMSLEAISDYVTAMTLITPTNGSQLSYNAGTNATGVVLSWGSVPKATSYLVYIGTSQSSMALSGSGTTGTTYTVGGLTENTAYYWQVVAQMPGGRTKPSSVWVFTTNCPITKTYEGGTCVQSKTVGNCNPPSGVSNYVFSSGATYAPIVNRNGSAWPAVPTTPATPKSGVPTINTCEWNCASGYGRYSGNCIATPSATPATVCTAPASASYYGASGGSYAFYNGTTSYTPRKTRSSYAWSTQPTTPATPVTTPTIDTCQRKVVCPSGWTLTASNKCEKVVYQNYSSIGDDGPRAASATWYKCPTNSYLSYVSAIRQTQDGTRNWNYYYQAAMFVYSGNTRGANVGYTTCTNHSNYYSSYTSYSFPTYTNTNTSIDGFVINGGSRSNNCDTNGFRWQLVGTDYMSSTASGGQYYYFNNPRCTTSAGANGTGYSGCRGRKRFYVTMKCELK